jgi:hypothetical protein
MNSLSLIHSGSSANVMVFLETGLEKDAGASESSSARRELGTCRWRRVMMEMEQEQSAQAHSIRISINSSRNARKLSHLSVPLTYGGN